MMREKLLMTVIDVASVEADAYRDVAAANVGIDRGVDVAAYC